MTLTQLEYIVAIEQHRSFAEAAKKCGVAQPSLSTQVKKLEEELDVLLFDRSSKPVQPTSVGKQIIRQALVALQESRRIGQIVQIEKGVLKGKFRLGIIPTLSPYLLPLFVMDFMQSWPEVEVVVEELLSDQIIDRVQTEQLDVGILVTPVQEAQLQVYPLFYELFVLYISNYHPLTRLDKVPFEELDLADMWLLKEGHCFRSQVMNICGEAQSVSDNRLRFESGSLETLRRIVDQEYGYTLLPELATLEMDASQYRRIRHFQNPQPVREVSLICHRNAARSNLLQALQESISQNIPAILKNPDRGHRIEWK